MVGVTYICFFPIPSSIPQGRQNKKFFWKVFGSKHIPGRKFGIASNSIKTNTDGIPRVQELETGQIWSSHYTNMTFFKKAYNGHTSS